MVEHEALEIPGLLTSDMKERHYVVYWTKEDGFDFLLYRGSLDTLDEIQKLADDLQVVLKSVLSPTIISWRKID